MIRLILLLICLAGSVSAQVVTVRSGEHGDFTRIVLTLPAAGDWRIGRTETGYEVELPTANPRYNLSDVYRLITKDRLRDIAADPASGRLRLDIGCACHVIPFEFGPRNLVIDIRPGPPPEASSFEVPLSGGAAMAGLTGIGIGAEAGLPEVTRPAPVLPDRKPAYSWIDNRVAVRPIREPVLPFPKEPAPPGTEAPDSVADVLSQELDAEVDLAGFRELLIDQIGVGATQGVVDLQLPAKPTAREGALETPEQARVALSRLPGLSVDAGNRTDGLQTDGQTCPDEDRLAMKDWSATDDAASEISAAKGKLLAEFDLPQAEQITAATRVHLFFGFGAEARNLLFALSKNDPPDPFLVAMSYLVDEDRSLANPFANMQSCDSNAALWALLAAPDTEPLDGLNGAAVARGAMELPNHVRSVLAPRVVTRLQALNDPTNAEVVQNALARAVSKDDPTLRLLDAEIALSENRPAEAELHLNSLDEGEATLAGLFARVEARFQQQIPVEQADILALEAFAFEQGSGAKKEDFQIALTRAYALSGAFEKAFGMAGASPQLDLDVWRILANSGADSDILTYAIGLTAPAHDLLPGNLRSTLAERLLKIGLPNAAERFLNDETDTQLQAEVSLANGDGRKALRVLASAEGEAEPTLTAKAYEGLGQYETAADLLRAAGQEDEAARVERRQRKWPEPSGNEADPWAKLAAFAKDQAEDPPLPPLRAAQDDLDRSVATRAGIEALLQGVPPPS